MCVCVCERRGSTSKNSPSRHKYESPKHIAYLDTIDTTHYPVFEDEKSNGSHEKSVKQKIA